MSNKIKVLGLSRILAKYYFKGRKALRTGDKTLINYIAKNMTSDILLSANKKINLINPENLAQLDGSLILSNHQDTMDIFSLTNINTKPVRFVAKKELFNIPVFKTYITLSGSYGIDRSDARQGVKVFKQVIDDVNNHNANVVIFPEATRSNSDLMSEFNSGLFNIIKRCKKPLIPVYIDGSYDETSDVITMIIGEPIENDVYKNLNGSLLKELVNDTICQLKAKYLVGNKRYNILGLGDSITFGEDYSGKYTDGYFYRFTDELKKQSLLNKEYNLAIPGLTLKELLVLLDKDNYSELVENRVLDDNLVNKLISKKDKSIQQIISESDYLIMTCGANDSLSIVKKGKVSTQEIYDSFKEIYNLSFSVLKKIEEINPRLKVILIGLYYPYPHLKNLRKFDKMDSLDAYYLKLERKFKRLAYISTYKDVFENKDKFLENKRNIHLNDEGYSYLKTRVVGAFQKLSKIK